MVLNTVDLQCSSCYKKVKKVICKFPQIRDQVYDEKNNKVSIKVLCCSPEKIRDKLCCKGGKVIKSIEILEPPKPKPPENPKQDDKPNPPPEKQQPKQDDKPKPPPPEKPKEADKLKPPPPQKPAPPPEMPKEADKPKPPPPVKPKEADKPREVEKPKPPPPEKSKEPVQRYPGYPPMYPRGACCGSCYEGYGGGPCFHGYGRPGPPPPGLYDGACCGLCYEGYSGRPCFHGYGRPVPPPPGPCYDGYGYGYGYPYRGSKCCVNGDYFSEENTQGCTIM